MHRPFKLGLGALVLLILVACSGGDATRPEFTYPVETEGTLANGGADFELKVDAVITPDTPVPGPFALQGSNLRYDDGDGVLLVDLVVVNRSERRLPEPVTLTFTRLLPAGVTLWNAPDGGDTYTFGFANDDALWTPGETSLPLTVAFLVDDGVAVGFTARIGAGLPVDAGLIGGMVFADYDGDGVRDEGEEGVPGAVIELRHDQREMLSRTVTAPDGRYRFGGLVAGAYTVTLAPQPLLAPTGDPVLHVLLTTTADGVSRFEEADFGALWAPGDSLGGNAVADATVRADVDSRRNDNYGADPFLAVGTGREGPSSPDRIRGYVRFEVPVFFREISAAHLELTIAAFRDGVDQTYELSVHRVLPTEGRTPWIEGNGSEVTPAPPGVEWVDAAAGIAWTGAADGGDANNQTQPEFAADASASLTLVQADHAVGDVIRIDVTDLVRGWINGDYPNEGLVLRDTGPGGFRQLWFGARDGLLRGYQDDRVQPGPRLVFE